MKDNKIYNEFQKYRRVKIYNHIKFFSKYISLLGAIVVFGLTYAILGYLTYGIVIILLSYISLFFISEYIIKNDIITNFEDYAGPIIYVSTSYLLCCFDLQINVNNNYEKYFSPRGTTQLTSLLSWIFVQDFKNEVICKIIQGLIYILFRNKVQNRNVDIHELADMGMDISYYIFLSYLLNSLNYQFFCSFLGEIKESILQFSDGMDKLDSNVLLLDINKGKKIKINTCSSEILQNFSKINDIDEINAIELLESFSFLKQNLSENNLKQSSSLNDQIQLLLNSDSDNQKLNINNIFHKKNNISISPINIYSSQSMNGKINYYEIKIVKYPHNSTIFNQDKILLLFKKTDNLPLEEANNIKRVSMEFNNQEIKNTLYLIKNNIRMINSENNYIVHNGKRKFSDETFRELFSNGQIKINDNNNIRQTNDIIKNNINYTYNYSVLRYLIIKAVFFINNFNYFSAKDFVFNKPCYSNYALSYVLVKSLTFITNTNSQLKIDPQLNMFSINTDLKYFKLMVRYIVFYLESYTSITNILVKFLKKDEEFFKIIFYAIKCEELNIENNYSKKTKLQQSLFSAIEKFADFNKLKFNQIFDDNINIVSVELEIRYGFNKDDKNKNIFNCHLLENKNNIISLENKLNEKNHRRIAFASL